MFTGPEQNRPENFAVELQNISFKEALVSFLMEHWSTDEVANEFGDKEIYVSFDKCYRYYYIDYCVVVGPRTAFLFIFML